MATKKMKSGGKKVVANKKRMGMKVGVGVAAGVAAALAGAYLLYAKSAAPQRKKAKAWVAKARKDVAREVGKLKNVSAAQYAGIIDSAMRKYAAVKDASAPEIVQAAREMKAEWKNIQTHAKKIAKATTAGRTASKRKPASAKRRK